MHLAPRSAGGKFLFIAAQIFLLVPSLLFLSPAQEMKAQAKAATRMAPVVSCDYEKMFGREDKTIFGRDCGLCHSISGTWDKPGPALGGIFSKKQMATGEPVNEESVRKKIAEGGPGMPSFQYTLTAAQITELVRYLKTVNCPEDESIKKAKEEVRKSQENAPK